ncbi:hypothetical protein BC829DRAFT_448571 [Chytridium lagenaria]|nr:hypothetical protein BC829DRAFT_448571 [Chytridium lagenaria]
MAHVNAREKSNAVASSSPSSSSSFTPSSLSSSLATPPSTPPAVAVTSNTTILKASAPGTIHDTKMIHQQQQDDTSMDNDMSSISFNRYRRFSKDLFDELFAFEAVSEATPAQGQQLKGALFVNSGSVPSSSQTSPSSLLNPIQGPLFSGNADLNGGGAAATSMLGSGFSLGDTLFVSNPAADQASPPTHTQSSPFRQNIASPSSGHPSHASPSFSMLSLGSVAELQGTAQLVDRFEDLLLSGSLSSLDDVSLARSVSDASSNNGADGGDDAFVTFENTGLFGTFGEGDDGPLLKRLGRLEMGVVMLESTPNKCRPLVPGTLQEEEEYESGNEEKHGGSIKDVVMDNGEIAMGNGQGLEGLGMNDTDLQMLMESITGVTTGGSVNSMMAQAPMNAMPQSYSISYILMMPATQPMVTTTTASAFSSAIAAATAAVVGDSSTLSSPIVSRPGSPAVHHPAFLRSSTSSPVPHRPIAVPSRMSSPKPMVRPGTPGSLAASPASSVVPSRVASPVARVYSPDSTSTKLDQGGLTYVDGSPNMQGGGMIHNGMQVRPTFVQSSSGPMMVTNMNGQFYSHPPNSIMMQGPNGPVVCQQQPVQHHVMMQGGLPGSMSSQPMMMVRPNASFPMHQQQSTMVMQNTSPNTINIQPPKRPASTPVPAATLFPPSHHIMSSQRHIASPLGAPPTNAPNSSFSVSPSMPSLTSPSSSQSASPPPPPSNPMISTPNPQLQQMHIHKLQHQHLQVPQRPRSAMAGVQMDPSFFSTLQQPFVTPAETVVDPSIDVFVCVPNASLTVQDPNKATKTDKSEGRERGRKDKYKCPKPYCSKSYKNLNGLKYHLERGNCELENTPETAADAQDILLLNSLSKSIAAATKAPRPADDLATAAEEDDAMSSHSSDDDEDNAAASAAAIMVADGRLRKLVESNGDVSAAANGILGIKIARRPYCIMPKVSHVGLDFKVEVKGHVSLAMAVAQGVAKVKV